MEETSFEYLKILSFLVFHFLILTFYQANTIRLCKLTKSVEALAFAIVLWLLLLFLEMHLSFT